jgi:hypothetical protein
MFALAARFSSWLLLLLVWQQQQQIIWLQLLLWPLLLYVLRLLQWTLILLHCCHCSCNDNGDGCPSFRRTQ